MDRIYLPEPDNETWKAIYRLRSDTDFQKFVSYLEAADKQLSLDSLETYDEGLIGQRRALVSLLNIFAASREVVENIVNLEKQQQKRPGGEYNVEV